MVTYTLFKWLHAEPLPPILFGLILMDIATGFVAAFITKQASSIASYNGAGRKSLILLIVGACAIIDPLTGGFPVFKGACLFYIFSEMLSVVKNCARAGVPFPKIILDALIELQAKQTQLQNQSAQTIQNTFNNGPATIQIVPDADLRTPSKDQTSSSSPTSSPTSSSTTTTTTTTTTPTTESTGTSVSETPENYTYRNESNPSMGAKTAQYPPVTVPPVKSEEVNH